MIRLLLTLVPLSAAAFAGYFLYRTVRDFDPDKYGPQVFRGIATDAAIVWGLACCLAAAITMLVTIWN